jgi:hypothetical protein
MASPHAFGKVEEKILMQLAGNWRTRFEKINEVDLSLISMKRKLSSILIGSIFLFAFTWESPLDQILSSYKRYLEERPQEKIYVHLDRPYYASGETIWLKAYLVAGPFHEPSPLSYIIYIELIDQLEKVVQTTRLLADQSSAGGYISLSNSLPTGNYTIRAYTQWMRNFDESYFYHQRVRIFNPDITKETKQDDNIDLQFFPEGGYLVNGLKSKLAFKATGTDGLSRKVKGRIVNSKGTPVATIETNFLGMGYCNFMPEAGNTYKVIIENSTIEKVLPDALESGIVMSVTNDPNQNDIVIRIQTSLSNINKTVFLIGQTRGLVNYAVEKKLIAPISFAKIPKSNFPTGVSQLTMIEEDGTPLLERLIFVDENKPLSIKITSDKKIYKPREKITMSISTQNADGTPAISDLSLAVCDSQQILIDDNRESICSYLFLSSDLRGYIESPGYYFNAENKNRVEDLDALLLTQGWRRFLPTKDFPAVAYKAERGLTISGHLLDKYNNKPIANGKVSYLSTFPMPDAKNTSTNENGEFAISPVLYFDSAQAVLQGETRKGNKAVKFVIDTVLKTTSMTFPISLLEGSLDEYEKEFIKKTLQQRQIDAAFNFDPDAKILDAVEVKGQRESASREQTKIYGNGSVTMKVANDPVLENLVHPLQLLQGRVAGVQVTGSGGSWTVLIRGVNSIASGTTPLIMVNNTPVDIDYLSMLSVRDIESFDVWKGSDAAMFGSRGANGVIGFYTKRGEFLYEPKEGVFPFSLPGLQSARVYYTPQYDVQKPEHVKPDRRITLFWAPNIRTDSTGKATVSFYNHDLETSVTGIIEGLSSKGTPGVSTIKYLIQE